MGSSGKKRTTRAKLDREGKLREKRVEKQARKAARRLFTPYEASESVSRFEALAGDPSRLEDSLADARPEPAAVSDVVTPRS